MVESSWYGEVSMVARGSPLFLPVVVSSITGIPEKCQPSRPPEAPSRSRWTRFMALSERSEGMAASVEEFVAVSPNCTDRNRKTPIVLHCYLEVHLDKLRSVIITEVRVEESAGPSGRPVWWMATDPA